MTRQVEEILRYQGRTEGMTVTPPRPGALPLDDFLERSGRKLKRTILSSGLHRGYRGKWELRRKRLYLVGLELSYDKKNSLGTVFPGYPNRVFAHWFTGRLEVPRGKRLPPLTVGIPGDYEGELILNIESGVLVGGHEIFRGSFRPVYMGRRKLRKSQPEVEQSNPAAKIAKLMKRRPGEDIFATATRVIREVEEKYGPLPNVLSVKPSDLLSRVCLGEVEKRERVADPLGAVPDLPFGHFHDTWKTLVKSMERGDECWRFHTECPVPHYGIPEPVSGYAIVRDGEIAGHFVAHRAHCPYIFHHVSFAPRFATPRGAKERVPPRLRRT